MGCAFCALPRSKQLRRPGASRAHCPRWAMHLIHFPGPSRSVSQCTTTAQSQVYQVSPLGSWSQVVTLLTYVNRPRSQEDLVSNWEPAQFGGRCISGAEIVMAYCLPAPAVTHLPLCLWEGRAPNGSQVALIWYSLGSNPLFCEHVLWAFQGHCAALEPFPGKFFVVLFCFVLVSRETPWFWLLCQISPQIFLRAFKPVPYPRDWRNSAHLPVQPPLAAHGCECLSSFSAGSCGYMCILCVYTFCPVVLLSEISELPTDMPVREFPIVWKLLLLLNSLPRMGLHP